MATQRYEDGVEVLGVDLTDRITELLAFAADPARRADALAGLVACAVEAAHWRGGLDPVEQESLAAVIAAVRRHQQAMASPSRLGSPRSSAAN